MTERKKRVYILDDEKFILVLAEKMLTARGYEAAVFQEAEDFLNAVKNFLPDAAVIDYMMPGFDGAQIIERMKSENVGADIPIILYSAADPVLLSELVKSAGAVGYIPKGVKMTDFVARMEALLDWK